MRRASPPVRRHVPTDASSRPPPGKTDSRESPTCGRRPDGRKRPISRARSRRTSAAHPRPFIGPGLSGEHRPGDQPDGHMQPQIVAPEQRCLRVAVKRQRQRLVQEIRRQHGYGHQPIVGVTKPTGSPLHQIQRRPGKLDMSGRKHRPLPLAPTSYARRMTVRCTGSSTPPNRYL